ncbi:hypothetical protein EDB89DRAFT_1326315 [Lactarius sanguifluus]|nr:hypothetical protein EDB89DRAFT_1326315 [Lactarius sanguifluus]
MGISPRLPPVVRSGSEFRHQEVARRWRTEFHFHFPFLRPPKPLSANMMGHRLSSDLTCYNLPNQPSYSRIVEVREVVEMAINSGVEARSPTLPRTPFSHHHEFFLPRPPRISCMLFPISETLYLTRTDFPHAYELKLTTVMFSTTVLHTGDRIITATFNTTLHPLAQHSGSLRPLPPCPTVCSILPGGKEGSGLRNGRMTLEKRKQGTHAIRNYCRLGARAPRALSDLSVGAIWVVPTTCSHLRASLRSLGVWAGENGALQHVVHFHDN